MCAGNSRLCLTYFSEFLVKTHFDPCNWLIVHTVLNSELHWVPDVLSCPSKTRLIPSFWTDSSQISLRSVPAGWFCRIRFSWRAIFVRSFSNAFLMGLVSLLYSSPTTSSIFIPLLSSCSSNTGDRLLWRLSGRAGCGFHEISFFFRGGIFSYFTVLLKKMVGA